MKILLLEDELMLQRSIEEYILALGYEIDCFSDGLEAHKQLANNEYDLLLLDINVPNFTGLELLKDINIKDNFIPSIFISADTTIDTISDAFEEGAVDYLKKPFHLKELGLRIQKEVESIEKAKNLYIVLNKHYQYSSEKKILYYNKKTVALTKKQISILDCLCKNINTIVSLEMLRYDVWESEPVSDATIRAEISRFRKTLKDDFIQNIKGVGYKVERYFAN